MSARAVIYARLSPSPRGDSFKGGNLDQQVAKCRTKCEESGWEVVRVIEDREASAVARKPRPGWQTLLRMVETGQVDVIIGRHYDRLYRRPVDLEELIRLTEDTGVRIVAAEGDSLGIDLTTATGLLQARILVAFAAGEVDLKRERHKAGQWRRVEAGRPFWGNRPFGYQRDLSINEAEAEHIRNAYEAILRGVTVNELVREWNERGLLTINGEAWANDTIRLLLRNPRNAGLVVYDGLEIDVNAAWPALVDLDLYRAVVQILKSQSGGGVVRPYLRLGVLSGVGTCGALGEHGAPCGGNIYLTANRARQDGFRLRKYRCDCGRASFPADLLEDYVMAVLLYRSALSRRPAPPGVELQKRRAERKTAQAVVNELTSRKDRLRDLFVTGTISVEDFVTGNRLVDRRLAAAHSRLYLAKVAASETPRADHRRVEFSELVAMYCDPARHVELRSIIQSEVVSLATTSGTNLKRYRAIEEIVATWRGKDQPPHTIEELTSANPQAWVDAQARMSAARAEWAKAHTTYIGQELARRTRALTEMKQAVRPAPPPPPTLASG